MRSRKEVALVGRGVRQRRYVSPLPNMVIVQEWHFKLEFGIFYCRLQYTDELNEGNTITILSINKSLVVYSCEMNHFSVICL